MRIRAHHLLCARNFSGKGYSPEFVSNFFHVLRKLPDEKIEVINSVDVICNKCPHNKRGKCQKKRDSVKRVKQLDNAVIKTAKIDMNKRYSYQTLKKLVKEVKTKDFCKDCEWKCYCD
jgi:hypothetical protein